MDPGRDTGLSLLRITPDSYRMIEHQVVTYAPESFSSPLTVLKEWTERYPQHPHILVYENFHVRPGKKSVDTTAINVIGGVEHWLMEAAPYVQVFPREPVQGKHLVTDEVLVNAGLHVCNGGGARHVRDANRHAVAYLQQIGHIPLCRAAWPRKSVQS